MLYLLSSFLLCLILVPIIKKIAHKNGWLAYPKKDRWHNLPTPYMGGIAIYLAIIVPMIVASDFSYINILLKSDLAESIPPINIILIPGISFMFLLGIIDDIKGLKPHTKLIGQIMAASMVAFAGYRLNWSSSLTIDTIITIIWIAGITNAFNLLDNMDGLCAGSGFFASVTLAFLFNNSPDISICCFIICGALLAFLIFNFNPASIFMGDCGSLTIGFSLSTLCLSYTDISQNNNFSIFLIPILTFIVPIIDTTLVTFVRILSGRKAYIGGKDHTSHRLVLMGFSEKGAVIVLYGISFTSGLAALFVQTHDSFTSPIVVIPLITSIILLTSYLTQIRVYPEKEFCMLRGRRFSPFLEYLAIKRQIFFVILDFCIIAFSYYLSYKIRFSGSEFSFYFKIFLNSLPAVIVCKFVAFYYSDIYKGIWNYLTITDIAIFIKASFLGSLFAVSIVTFLYRFEYFSKGIFIIDYILTTSIIAGVRVSFRFFAETMNRKTLDGENVIIYGAGKGGEILIREILSNKSLKIKPLGFIDDNVMKVGKKLQGYPIIGTINDLDKICNKNNVSGILISINIDKIDSLNEAKEICKKYNLYLKQFNIQLNDILL